ncbi:MAG: alpha-E domain-containing protein [Balneolaceae bacterium]
MLSRVAESIYWLGRYVERAENYARFIDVNFNLMLDLPPGLKEQWEPLIAATGDLKAYNEQFDSFDRLHTIFFLAFDADNPNSMFSSIIKARENARTVREKITKESWEKLNEVYLFVKEGVDKKVWEQEDPREFITTVKYKIQLLYGIGDNSVARTEGYYFLKLGQFLERADKTSRILDVKYHILLPSPKEVGTTLDILQWMALLKSVSGFNIYRQIYGNIDPSKIVEFLVLNKYFPRSIYFCLTEAEDCLQKISESPSRGFRNNAEKHLGALCAHLEFSDVNDVINLGLHEFLDELQLKLNHISIAIHNHFFTVGDTLTTQEQAQ